MSITTPIRNILKSLYYQRYVRRVLIVLRSIFIPKPIYHPNMEFVFGVWQGDSSVYDQDGRQLGEDNVWPAFYRLNAPTRYRKTKIEGSRYNKTINLSAFEIVMRNWDPALALTRDIRQQYMKSVGRENQDANLSDVYHISRLGISIIAFAIRSTDSNIKDGQITSSVSTLYKIIAGLFLIIETTIKEDPTKLNLQDSLSAESLYDYTDENDIFISILGGACAGSKRKVIELMGLVLTGTEVADYGQVDGLSVSIDNDSFYDYAMTGTALELMQKLCRNRIIEAILNSGNQQTAAFEEFIEANFGSTPLEKIALQNNAYELLLVEARPHLDSSADELKEFENILQQIQNGELSNTLITYDTCAQSLIKPFTTMQNKLQRLLGLKTPTLNKTKIKKNLNLNPELFRD